MVGNIKSNSKFQYLKRQDICRIENPVASKPAGKDNLAFSEDQVLEDKLDIKFTVRDSGD